MRFLTFNEEAQTYLSCEDANGPSFPKPGPGEVRCFIIIPARELHLEILERICSEVSSVRERRSFRAESESQVLWADIGSR